MPLTFIHLHTHVTHPGTASHLNRRSTQPTTHAQHAALHDSPQPQQQPHNCLHNNNHNTGNNNNGVTVLLHTVELHVTLLGCDHGYYADEALRPALVCRECVCGDDDGIDFFTEGRNEAFVEEEG